MPGHKSVWAKTPRKKRPTERAKAMEKARNTAPTQWGRRLARLVGDKFGAQMSENHSKNVGSWRGQAIVIKCAKSPMPPVSVLTTMLDHIDLLWAVYIMPEAMPKCGPWTPVKCACTVILRTAIKHKNASKSPAAKSPRWALNWAPSPNAKSIRVRFLKSVTCF
jgi:hypothetical protein